MNYMKNNSSKVRSEAGFSIMEVIIGIVIFAIGMLALASFQAALTRSTVEAKVRTEAVNIAEEFIEFSRGFADVTSGGGAFAYNDIQDGVLPTYIGINPIVGSNGVKYTIAVEVTDYYYDLAGDNFITTAPAGAIVSDYKTVELTVSWGDDVRNFVVGEGLESTDNLGGGSIQVTANISALSVASTGRVTEESDSSLIAPPIIYEPGLNPDIVALDLGGSKFKESLTPEPEVTRNDELVETRFDVVTYSQAGSALFLRREEFAAVSCECTLKAKPGSAVAGGRRPTIWVGDEYLDPEFIDKAYGISASTQQSPLCDTCCRDHHDGGTGTNDPGDAGSILYNPYRAKQDYMTGTFAGDHEHFKKNGSGVLSVAGADDIYLEACRMVRQDGFFKVGQDFSLEGLNVFPYDFLVSSTDISNYSGWLTGSVETFMSTLITNNGYGSTNGQAPTYDFVAPDLGEPGRTASPETTVGMDDLTFDYTSLPAAFNANFQQLRSRGVYVDYISEDLRLAINCAAGGDDAETCRYGDVYLDKVSVHPVTGRLNVLEIIPFFEVQVTFLNGWAETSAELVVDVTSEPLETGNTHSRGEVSQVGTDGSARVKATGHTGVLGFTDTDPIDNRYDSNLADNDIEVILSNSGTPTINGITISGTISSGVRGVQARNVLLETTNATCNYVGVTFTCIVPSGGGAILKVSNYHKQNDTDIDACSDILATTQGTDTSNNPWTKFSLDGLMDGATNYHITIVSGACVVDDGTGF